MEIAGFIVSILGAFGAGAFANHFLARRREESAEQRAVSRTEYEEDRAQALKLLDLAEEMRRELGPRWDTDEPFAERYVAVLTQRTAEIETSNRRLHDPTLRLSVVWVPGLLGFAAESLKETEHRQAVLLADQALQELEGNAEAFVGKRPPSIMSDLYKAYYDELRPLGDVDHSPHARVERIYERWEQSVKLANSRSS